MASQATTVNSRLAEMQMKFQKKQKLELEQKKLALTVGDISQSSKSMAGNGKVRQMFDDRRRGIGIDRSHPLRPIMSSTITTTRTHQPANNKVFAGITNAARRPGLADTVTIKSKSINHNKLNNNYLKSNESDKLFGNNIDEIDNIDNETFPMEFSSLSLNNTQVRSSYATNGSDFQNNIIEESSPFGGTVVLERKSTPKTNAIKLNPVITKKSPASVSKTSSGGSRMSTTSKMSTSSVKSPLPKAPSKSVKTTASKTVNSKPATFVLSVKPPPRISTPPPGMAACQHCQRHFNDERLVKHEEVCRKMMSKKRKIFDASKHRVKGTEAEKYLKKTKVNNATASKNVTAAINRTEAVKDSNDKKSNWRKKHEDFINAIREAKKVQAHLAKGGKLSDLPPPPPSENPDYIQCPHCSRRFNQSAADRHIPKCANMQHNKPKPIRKR